MYSLVTRDGKEVAKLLKHMEQASVPFRDESVEVSGFKY
jgi:hypothetical protein